MTRCAQCSLQLLDESGFCVHHVNAYSDNWAQANRTLCDFFHRGIVPARLSAAERKEDFWGGEVDAAV